MTTDQDGRTALIVVDVQVDFCEGGSIAVPGGADTAAAIGRYVCEHRREYAAIVATADWHEDPGAHWSDTPDFVDSWPVHCRVGSDGARFHENAEDAFAYVDAVFRKGVRAAAYSGFEGVTGDVEQGQTLQAWLREHRVEAVDIVGLATDHCVRATALDAIAAGLPTRVLLGLTAGVSAATTDAALAELDRAGVRLQGEPVVRSR